MNNNYDCLCLDCGNSFSSALSDDDKCGRCGELSRLRAELAEAKRDSERLDWLEKNERGVWVCTETRYQTFNDEITSFPQRFYCFDGWIISDPHISLVRCKTPREAIDAAIAQAKKGGQL